MAVSCARLVLMLLMSTALRAGGLQLAGRAVARTRPRRRLALPRVVAVARDAYTDAGAPARLGRPPASAKAAEPIPMAESDVVDAEVHEVLDATAAAAAVDVLRAHPELIHACDTEVAGLDLSKSPIGQGRVICISVYSGPEIDFGTGPGRALWIDTTAPGVLEAMRPWLEDEGAKKVWHNYGFDRHVLNNEGIDLKGFSADTMHMARLWDASRKSGYSLEQLTAELVGRRKTPMKEIFGVPRLKRDGTPGKSIITEGRHEV